MELYLIYSPYGETFLKKELSAEDKQLEFDGELEIYRISSPQDIAVSRVTTDFVGAIASTKLEAESVG